MSQGGLLLGILACLTSAGTSEASVIWTFSQQGNDVVAVATGNWLYGEARIGSSNWMGSQAGASTFYLFAMDVPTGTLVNESFQPQGYTIVHNFGSSPDVGTGTFGFIGAKVYTGPTFNDGSAINASLTWYDDTLDGVLGAGQALPGTPIVLFQETSDFNGGLQTISIVRAVPEPATAGLLMGGAVIGLLSRRRRPRENAGVRL